MPSPNRVSVIIPTFQRTGLLAEAVESVLRQSLSPQEIIVVDDGSGPDFQSALDSLPPGIIVLRLPQNLGPAAARNLGIAQAQGELIAFMDSDDTWAPQKLEKQVAYLRENPLADGVHAGLAIHRQNGPESTHSEKPSPLKIEHLLKESLVSPPTLLIRKKALEAVQGFDEHFRCSEDYDLSIRLVQAGKRIDFLPEVLVHARYGHGNNTSYAWRRVLGNHLRLVYKHRALFRAQGGPGEIRRQISKHFLQAGRLRGGPIGRVLKIFGRVLNLAP